MATIPLGIVARHKELKIDSAVPCVHVWQRTQLLLREIRRPCDVNHVNAWEANSA